jgi:hypothetical protein
MIVIQSFPHGQRSTFRAFSASVICRSSPGPLAQAFTFRAVGAEPEGFTRTLASSVFKLHRYSLLSVTTFHCQHGKGCSNLRSLILAELRFWYMKSERLFQLTETYSERLLECLIQLISHS